MLNLSGTTQKLQVQLGAAKTTNDCPVYASFRTLSGFNLGPNSTVANLAPQVATTNGVTAVDVVSSPANSTTAIALEHMAIYNADTVPNTFNVLFNNNGTTYVMFSAILQPGQTLYYDASYGWQVSPLPSPMGKIASLIAAGTLHNTYTTAKSILPGSAIPTIAANSLRVGQQIIVEGIFGVSNIVTTPGTLTLQVMLGSVVAFTTGAIQLNATAHTLLPLWVRIMLTVRSIGSGTAATLMGQGVVIGMMPTATAGQTDGANTMAVLNAPATTPTVGTGFDSTVSNTIDFWAGFSISNAGNGIQAQQYLVRVE